MVSDHKAARPPGDTDPHQDTRAIKCKASDAPWWPEVSGACVAQAGAKSDGSGGAVTSPSLPVRKQPGMLGPHPKTGRWGLFPMGIPVLTTRALVLSTLYFSDTGHGHSCQGSGLGSDTPEGHMRTDHCSSPCWRLQTSPQKVLTPGQNDKLVKFNTSDIFISKNISGVPNERTKLQQSPFWGSGSPSAP